MRLAAIFFLLVRCVYAQSPQVPHKINFAGITLTIRDDARREIQKDVDALTQYPKYFNIKVERARTYFPIIEKIFQEERLPDDFKYLVLQESALIADAVSVSDAVGFWQFKDFTAIEMGLRVDKEIDERMNIASSTRAAAQYIKKNNHFFNNWVYALQAYQMGAGGVMRSLNDYESGTRHMEITSQTYWYVKKFLAHKVAFESTIKGGGEIKLITYESQSKKTLTELAKEFSVSSDQLQAYNKWVKKGVVPDDRNYVVSIPVQGEARNVYAAVEKANSQAIKETQQHHRKLDAKPAIAVQSNRKYIHGLPAIKAVAGESAATLSKRAGVSLSFFLSCNDLSISDPILEGEYYYLKKKKARASTASHTVMLPGENLWIISQQYGVQLKKLKKLNSFDPSVMLKQGTIITLPAAPVRPGAQEATQVELAEVATGEFFNWSIGPKAEQASINTGAEERVVNVSGNLTNYSGPSSATITQVEPVVGGQHIVSQGETLYSISKKYGVGVMDLVSRNQLKLEEGIKPGQVLKIDTVSVEGPTEPGEFIIYEVKASDTLYSVARQYGVTIKELMDWNKKKDFAVAAGEKLRIQQK